MTDLTFTEFTSFFVPGSGVPAAGSTNVTPANFSMLLNSATQLFGGFMGHWRGDDQRKYAQALLVAHLAELLYSEDPIKSQSSGPLKSVKSRDDQMEFSESGSSKSAIDSFLSQTVYGRMFLFLLDVNYEGGLAIGPRS